MEHRVNNSHARPQVVHPQTGDERSLAHDAAPRFSPRYRPELDGLRALAITLVILNHARIAFSGGFVGVDVFFVLSGFLMTGIIMQKVEANQFSFREFLTRRVRRILPAKLLVSCCTLAVGYFLLLPDSFAQTGGLLFSEGLFSSNIFLWRTTDYFGTAAEQQPLLHYWSLATEEQFYLCFPFLLLLVFRYRKDRVLEFILLLTAISATCSLWLTSNKPWAAYYLLPSRAWELFLGGCVWFVSWESSPRPVRQVCELIGLTAIIAGATFITESTTFPGLAAWPVCGGTALLIWSNTGEKLFAGKILALPPMVYLGQLSYSLYLWHWPLLVFLRPFEYDESSALICGNLFWTLLLVLSVLCHHLVEQPARFNWLKAKPRMFLGTICSLTVVVSLLAFLTWHSDGYPKRFSLSILSIAADSEPPNLPGGNDLSLDDALQGEIPRSGCATDCTGKILLWGDSHALALFPVVEAIAVEQHMELWRATHSQTAPIIQTVQSRSRFGLNEKTGAFNDAVSELVAQQEIDCVVACCVWDAFAKENRERFRRELREGVRSIIKNGAKLILVRDVARQDCQPPNALLAHKLLGRATHELGRSATSHHEEIWETEKILQDVADEFSGMVNVVDPADVLAPDRMTWRIELDGRLIYRDVDHLSPAGAMHLKPLLEASILQFAD